jgi:MFS family permease
MMNAPGNPEVSWRVLLNRQYLPRLATMALALWLHASNSMLTATTMPSAVGEIGGLNLISWTFALYLAGSISAGASVSLLVAKLGLKATMIRAGMVFSIGCVVVATAPNMPVLLVGRVLQGLGGGGLIALVYISQDRFFPDHLVPRTVAFLSSVWMAAAFSGPVIGGAFATVGEWRLAEPIPIVRLLLLSASILLVSISGAYYHPLATPLFILLGCMALLLFVIRDRHAGRARMLPAEVIDFSHAIGNGILATFLLCISIGPLILIELYGMTPLQAGFVVLLESLAWGSAAILFSGIRHEFEPLLIRIGGALVLFGLVAMALVLPRGWLWSVVFAVIVLNGGFGMMWGFIIKRIVAAAPPAEKDRTASLLPITQQIGFALGAALCGLVANSLTISGGPAAADFRLIGFWLFAAFVPFALLGNLMLWRFVAPRPATRQALESVEVGPPEE